MASLKPTCPGFPEETSVRHFRNALIQLKKALLSLKEADGLNLQMEKFLNASRSVTWPHATSGVFHKEEAEKAMAKVTTEYQRYLKDWSKESFQNLMESLLIVESMLDQIKR